MIEKEELGREYNKQGEKEMLKEKKIKEEIEVVDGKVFAVFSCKEERRVIDGCAMSKELAEQILEK